MFILLALLMMSTILWQGAVPLELARSETIIEMRTKFAAKQMARAHQRKVADIASAPVITDVVPDVWLEETSPGQPVLGRLYHRSAECPMGYCLATWLEGSDLVFTNVFASEARRQSGDYFAIGKKRGDRVMDYRVSTEGFPIGNTLDYAIPEESVVLISVLQGHVGVDPTPQASDPVAQFWSAPRVGYGTYNNAECTPSAVVARFPMCASGTQTGDPADLSVYPDGVCLDSVSTRAGSGTGCDLMVRRAVKESAAGLRNCKRTTNNIASTCTRHASRPVLVIRDDNPGSPTAWEDHPEWWQDPEPLGGNAYGPVFFEASRHDSSYRVWMSCDTGSWTTVRSMECNDGDWVLY